VARIITNEKKILEEYEHLISDLERFTYTISHDLRSPLITIQGFLGILEQDLLVGKAEEVQRDMARIRQATGHMEDLLDQLLELARVGRVVLHLQPVNLGEVAALACAAQQVELDKRNITVSLAEDLPLVKADPVRLREVLDNLLSNAIRFMGNPAQPAIEIGCQVQHDETVCFVRDNGIGIDLRYHQKIFGLFEQLDAHSEGTGIGLALVKRIIELHNGRIWVESDGPDTGSTFYFTLPQD
jgi:signal transduction histidine kinase